MNSAIATYKYFYKQHTHFYFIFISILCFTLTQAFIKGGFNPDYIFYRHLCMRKNVT